MAAAPRYRVAPLILGNGSHAGSVAGDVVVTNGDIRIQRADRRSALCLRGCHRGSGRVYQFGPGTVDLSGNNSYSGPTNIENGSLVVGSPTALGSASPVYIPAGGTLELNGFSPTIGGLYDYGNGTEQRR